jgi:hypothetical protein
MRGQKSVLVALLTDAEYQQRGRMISIPHFRGRVLSYKTAQPSPNGNAPVLLSM